MSELSNFIKKLDENADWEINLSAEDFEDDKVQSGQCPLYWEIAHDFLSTIDEICVMHFSMTNKSVSIVSIEPHIDFSVQKIKRLDKVTINWNSYNKIDTLFFIYTLPNLSENAKYDFIKNHLK